MVNTAHNRTDYNNFDCLMFLKELWQIIPISIAFLYAILALTAKEMYNEMAQRAIHINPIDDLQTWRTSLVMICDFVDNLGQCFGAFILVMIGSNFASFIAIAFELSVAFLWNDTKVVLMFSAIGLKHLTQISIIILSTHLMQSKVKLITLHY